MTPAYYTVLSGDLVGSSHYQGNEYDTLITILKQGLNTICSHYGGEFDMYRGDAFQCIFSKQSAPLMMALLTRLFLKQYGIDARISEAHGPIEHYRGEIKSATGAALIASGKGLDNIKNHRLALTIIGQELSASFALNIAFVDNILSHVTKKQAQALYLYFLTPGIEHAQIAQMLDTSRENVTKLLNTGNYRLLDEFVKVATKEMVNE
ncbi:hypothetical protein AAEU32_00140 [Pseudoalteromonas sp. SSDWG2]|uniref:hypothetical protein n=1 Tax=Pseudoalteromonas sp. SSDWG2 TaxID=3139391 RepID=UPI003BA91E65